VDAVVASVKEIALKSIPAVVYVWRLKEPRLLEDRAPLSVFPGADLERSVLNKAAQKERGVGSGMWGSWLNLEVL